MALAKFVEDLKKQNDEIDYMNNYQSDVSPSPKLPDPVKCLWCDDIFMNKMDCIRHIKAKHCHLDGVLEINGQIVREEVNIPFFSKAKVRCSNSETKIYLNGKKVLMVDRASDVDITSQVSSVLSEHDNCEISINGAKTMVRVAGIENINLDEITDIIYRWQINVENGNNIQRVDDSKFNESEKLLLNGLFNYFKASRKECEEQNRRKRYEDAYACLSRLRNKTAIGRFVLKVIAFRLNWIGELWQLSQADKQDIFYQISKYYHHDKEFHVIDMGQMTASLYVEDQVKDCMDIMVALYSKDYILAQKIIDKYNSYWRIDDTNLRDRLLLAQSVLAASQGNIKKAKFFFEEIKTCYFIKHMKEFLFC